MDIEAIVEKSDFVSEANKANYKTWLVKVNERVGERDITPFLLNAEWLCDLFYLQNNCVVSRQSYQRIRKRIQNLVDYYKVNAHIPSHDEAIKARKITCFYKDLESLIGFIDIVGDKNMFEYDKHLDLLYIKAISIFGWYGFPLREVALLKKESLFCNGSYFFINDKEIDENSFNILKVFSVAKKHRSFPSGKTYVYNGNEEFFFRTSVADQKTTELNLQNYLAGFNREILDTKHSIVYKQLKKNAMFVSIANNKSLESATTQIEDIYGASPRDARVIKKEYDQWREDMGYNKPQLRPTELKLTREQIKELALQAGFEIKDPKQ